MHEIIAATFPRLTAMLRRRGLNRADAAGLILSARFGERASTWSPADCDRARRMIRAAFENRARPARLQAEG